MSRRKENVRKACSEINQWIKLYSKGNIRLDYVFKRIKKLTHRIKRTTWRGEDNKKSISDKRISVAQANRINTNQTTTANIDVSTIPYY